MKQVPLSWRIRCGRVKAQLNLKRFACCRRPSKLKFEAVVRNNSKRTTLEQSNLLLELGRKLVGFQIDSLPALLGTVRPLLIG